MNKSCLIDTTKCIGCRSCQISCKQWNGLLATQTAYQGQGHGVQNPQTLSAKTFCLVSFHEVEDKKSSAGMRLLGAKRQCMHCEHPACASACPVTALHKTEEGPVVYDGAKCLGCRYCVWACPFGVPTAEWDSLAPEIKKCTMCFDRISQKADIEEINGQPLSADAKKTFEQKQAVPACVKACPTGAISFGERDELLKEAKTRLQKEPNKYVQHIYGEKEVGGTGVMYLSSVPFDQIGFRMDLGEKAYPANSKVALGAVPPAAIGLGAVLGGVYQLQKRKKKVAQQTQEAESDGHGAHFAPIAGKWITPPGVVLILLMLAGAAAFVARFWLGLGQSTNLSDTYPWGLWILFDLVWIALAAGAFATAGIVYVFHQKEFYPIGRSAILMGFLSYSFVLVTLLADLGLPWHFWQLALQRPEHSAMFEVSWCVGLYVTILALEFAPMVFERFSMQKLATLWRKLSPLYVVVAITLFVFLMSGSFVWAGAAFAVFSTVAFFLRQRAHEKPVPIMLAIAAVTFSTMHQSSLGSLFLLMPDKLNQLWWSPILPIHFFLSSIAAGLSLIVLMVAFIDKIYRRPFAQAILPKMGRIVFWSLLTYLLVRLGDIVLSGKLVAAFTAPGRGLFLSEVLLGGLLPLLLLASAKLRSKPATLIWACALAAGGVVFNRANVVIFGMTLSGPAPGTQPMSYTPSLVEIAVTVSLIAATFFLFSLAAKILPVLSSKSVAAQVKQ